MKPKEFDDLVRQRFDQSDFEYNPNNWARLEEELDGHSRKRPFLLGWIPLMGIAASMAFAIGVSSVVKHAVPYHQAPAAATAKATTTGYQKSINSAPKNAATPASEETKNGNSQEELQATTQNSDSKTPEAPIAIENTATVAIAKTQEVPNNGLSMDNIGVNKLFDSVYTPKKKKKLELHTEPMYTFKQDVKQTKVPRTAILVSGGFNVGNQTNGYSIGASARRMISDKMFIEGDIAFTGSSNVQNYKYLDNGGTGDQMDNVGRGFAAKTTLTSKNASDDGSNAGSMGGNNGVIRSANRAYNLYYAQVTPTIGYKILKCISVGIGPDFQKVLVDNRPALSTVDRGNLQVAPMFDMGVMGKTEVSLSKNVKAAIYYREGINNVITPTNKYVERNYLQFQMRWAILNK